ncbi:Uncharacterised protein [Vibrio cholerae]|nr:Uncharacterised protein [Vibrio cholerae]
MSWMPNTLMPQSRCGSLCSVAAAARKLKPVSKAQTATCYANWPNKPKQLCITTRT